MAQVTRSAIVRYSAAKMYQLVNDVEHYPAFVGGCKRATVISRSETEQTARLEIAKGAISNAFTTSNQMIPNQRIDIRLVDGPFRQLHGVWLFEPLDDNSCRVSLNLQFEFNNKLIEFAFGRIFKEMANNMVSSFTRRAQEVYGV